MRHSALHSVACLFCCVSTALFANTQLQSASAQTKSQDTFPGETWQPRSSAETAKWSTDKLAAAHAYADSIHSSAVMIIQGGQVVDLLRARSGVYHPVDFETALMKKNRPERGSHARGTFWYYNNWDFNALGTIFEKEAGLKIGEAFYQ